MTYKLVASLMPLLPIDEGALRAQDRDLHPDKACRQCANCVSFVAQPLSVSAQTPSARFEQCFSNTSADHDAIKYEQAFSGSLVMVPVVCSSHVEAGCIFLGW